MGRGTGFSEIPQGYLCHSLIFDLIMLFFHWEFYIYGVQVCFITGIFIYSGCCFIGYMSVFNKTVDCVMGTCVSNSSAMISHYHVTVKKSMDTLDLVT